MDKSEADENRRILQGLIFRAWTDETFKQKLLADPMKVLAEEGGHLPPGMEFKPLENSEKVFHLVLPTRPTHLSDLDLDKIAAGSWDVFFGWPTI